MKSYLKFWWIAVLFVGASIIHGAGTVADMRDQREVARITKRMKTICVGRFLVDLPEEAEAGFGHGSMDSKSTRSTSREMSFTRVSPSANLSLGPYRIVWPASTI